MARYCSLWREDAVQAFVEEFQLQKVDFDGCAVGLVSTSGEPLLKPWQIFSDNRTLLTALIDQRCNKQQTHGVIAGRETARTASYPRPLCILLQRICKRRAGTGQIRTRDVRRTRGSSPAGGHHSQRGQQ